MTKHSDNAKSATCDNNVLANRLLYLSFYIKMMLFNGKIEWKNWNLEKEIDGFEIIYLDRGKIHRNTTLMNYSFVRIIEENSYYNTKISFISDLFFKSRLDNFQDLNNFCNKVFLTKNQCLVIKTPSKFEFLKFFYKQTTSQAVC